MHLDVPHEQIEAFCRKWKIREFGSLVPDLPESSDAFRVRVDFATDADHSLLDHVRLEREMGTLFETRVRVVENDTLDYPLYGLPEEQANSDLAYVLLMRCALHQMVEHILGLRCEIFERLQSLQDATIRQLIVVAELAARVSPTFRNAHTEVPWADLVELRNVLIQPYSRVSPVRVWQLIASDCPKIGAALDQIVGVEPAESSGYDINLSFSGWGVSSDPGDR